MIYCCIRPATFPPKLLQLQSQQDETRRDQYDLNFIFTRKPSILSHSTVFCRRSSITIKNGCHFVPAVSALLAALLVHWTHPLACSLVRPRHNWVALRPPISVNSSRKSFGLSRRLGAIPLNPRAYPAPTVCLVCYQRTGCLGFWISLRRRPSIPFFWKSSLAVLSSYWLAGTIHSVSPLHTVRVAGSCHSCHSLCATFRSTRPYHTGWFGRYLVLTCVLASLDCPCHISFPQC